MVTASNKDELNEFNNGISWKRKYKKLNKINLDVDLELFESFGVTNEMMFIPTPQTTESLSKHLPLSPSHHLQE